MSKQAMIRDDIDANVKRLKKEGRVKSFSDYIDQLEARIPKEVSEKIDLLFRDHIHIHLSVIKDTQNTKRMLDYLQVILIQAYNSPKHMKVITQKFEDILDDIREMKSNADKGSTK